MINEIVYFIISLRIKYIIIRTGAAIHVIHKMNTVDAAINFINP